MKLFYKLLLTLHLALPIRGYIHDAFARPIKMNPHCEYNICEKVPNYPENRVRKIINHHPAFRFFFGRSVIAPHGRKVGPRQYYDFMPRSSAVAPRRSYGDVTYSFDGNIAAQAKSDSDAKNIKTESMCKSRQITVIPRKMWDIHNIERIIPNVPEHRQTITYETCDHSGDDACYPHLDFGNYKFYCVQKYMDATIVTVNFDRNTLEPNTFKIPSNCVCEYRVE